jgi:mRNA interferase HigB
VRIVSEKAIRAFIQKEPRSAKALWLWADVIRAGSWKDPADLRGTFSSASFVGDLTIFNVGGNKYRIAAYMHYSRQIVYVKQIGTHQDYDTWKL